MIRHRADASSRALIILGVDAVRQCNGVTMSNTEYQGMWMKNSCSMSAQKRNCNDSERDEVARQAVNKGNSLRN